MLQFRTSASAGTLASRHLDVDNVAIAVVFPPVVVTAGDPPELTSVGGPYDLAPGETLTFTMPTTVTGVPANGFGFSNLAHANSTEQPAAVSWSVLATYTPPEP